MKKKLPTYIQEHKMTCGPATIRNVLDLLDEPNTDTEEEIRKYCRGGKSRIGMGSRSMQRGLEKYIDQSIYKIVKKTAQSYLSLKEDFSKSEYAVVLYEVDRCDNPHRDCPVGKCLYGMHWAVLKEVDSNNGIELINPFGSVDTFSENEWMMRRSFNHKELSLIERFLVVAGIISPKTIFYIQKLDE